MEPVAAQMQRYAHVVAALELTRGARILRVRFVVAIVRIVGLIFGRIVVVQIVDIDVIVVTIVIVIGATDLRRRTRPIVAYDAILVDGIAVGTVDLVVFV